MLVGAPVTNNQSRGVSFISKVYIALKVNLKKPKGSSRKLSIEKKKRS